jgi:hypothetical protein
MKKLTLIATLCLLMILSVQAEKKQTLTINGQTIEKIATRITFDGDNVVITFGDQTSQIADMEQVRLSFSALPTTIGTIKEHVADLLDINGIELGTTIEIYDAQGKKVITARADEARTILNTHSLKGGIYLLKANRQVVKFVKR